MTSNIDRSGATTRVVAMVLGAAERHRNVIASAVLAASLIDLMGFYVGGHPYRNYLLENADLLYLPALFSDVATKGGRLSDWYLTPAPYFFPDYLTYSLAHVIGSTTYIRLAIFAIAQTVLTLTVIWFLARGLSRFGAFASAVTTTIVLVWLAINAGEPFMILLASASHFGTFISTLLLAALWVRYQFASRRSYRFAVLGAMCILAYIATLSDNLFIICATLPLAVAAMAAAVGATDAGHSRRAPRVLIAAAWVGLMLVLPALVFRVAVPLPSVNVAWSHGIGDDQRATLEARFHLVGGDFRGGQLWTYQLADTSRSNVGALVRDPAVADTQHIDRQTFDVDGAAGPLQRALTVVPLGAALAAFAILGCLFVARLWSAIRLAMPLMNEMLPLAPVIFSAMGSASYGVVVANPSRYPLSIGLEKTYGNVTDMLQTFFGAVGNHPLFGVACAANIAAIAWALSPWRQSIHERQTPLISLVVFGGASICFTVIGLSVMTDLPIMPRYLIPVFCWPLVIVTLFARQHLGRWFLASAAVLSLLAAISLTSSAYTLVNNNGLGTRYYSGELACIDNALEDHGVTSGIAQYWDAKYLQQFSRLDLNVAQYLENLEEMRWITSKRYFKDDYDFAVVDENAEPTYKISVESLNRLSGPPQAIFPCGSRTLYIYGRGRLRTSSGTASRGSE